MQVAVKKRNQADVFKERLKKASASLEDARIKLRDMGKELIFFHNGPFAVGLDLKWGPMAFNLVTKIPKNVTFAKVFVPRAYIDSQVSLTKAAEGHLSQNFSVEYLG